MKRAQLEFGGKSAHIVLDDVTESDVAGIGFGQVLMHAGQACTVTSRLLLPEHLLDAYVEGLKAMAPMITVGDPRDPATVVGPLIRSSSVNESSPSSRPGCRKARGWWSAANVPSISNAASTTNRRHSSTAATTCGCARTRCSGPCWR